MKYVISVIIGIVLLIITFQLGFIYGLDHVKQVATSCIKPELCPCIQNSQNQAYRSQLLEVELKSEKKDLVTRGILTQIVEGKIIGLDYKSEERFRFTIQGKDGGESDIYYNSAITVHPKPSVLEASTKKAILAKNIKVGDTIIVETWRDLLHGTSCKNYVCFSRYIITKK